MKILVAMSGGVDSSVAAFELKKMGHEPIGATIKTWPREECGAMGHKLCCSLDAIQFARSAAEDMGIPFYVINFSSEFKKEVFDYFAAEYARGRTPNPCVYCNSRIKFGHFLRRARQIGAERIATGHYARISKIDNEYYITEARDKKKDQSYFLFDIARDTLSAIEFPVGGYLKSEVRRIARENGFMSAEREESQDICFASADGDYREYLMKKIGREAFSEGDILDTEGMALGKHGGIASYTIGQRRGLGVAMGEPVYVLAIDPSHNTITVGKKEAAMKKKMRVSGLNWLIPGDTGKPREFEVKIRYGSAKSSALVEPRENGEAAVEFREPQFAITPGQAAVFYDGEILAGGGWIEEAL